tara:strand:+ start:448 stop:594 length:147 start_codon:yes stop_codon:yes gene_type:complete
MWKSVLGQEASFGQSLLQKAQEENQTRLTVQLSFHRKPNSWFMEISYI